MTLNNLDNLDNLGKLDNLDNRLNNLNMGYCCINTDLRALGIFT